MKTPSYVIGYICAFILLLAITSPATETRRQNYTGKKDVISTASGQVTAMRTIAMGAKQAPIFTILFNDTSATQTVTGAGQLAPWSATTLDKNLPGLTPVQIYWNGRKPALFFLSPDVNRMFLTEDLGQPTSTILLPCAPPVQNDFQPLPDDLKKLAFLSVIFLDGEQAAQLTPKQIETIEQWIALGGVLCLDPQSLNALQQERFIHGIHAETDASASLDVKTPTTVLENLAGRFGELPPAIQQQRAAEQIQLKGAPGPDVLHVAKINIPDSDEVKKACVQTIGQPPAFVAWRYGNGLVSAQAFTDAGNAKLTRNWLLQQTERLESPGFSTPLSNIMSMFFMNSTGNRLSQQPGNVIYKSLPVWMGEALEAHAQYLLPIGCFCGAILLLFLLIRFVRGRAWLYLFAGLFILAIAEIAWLAAYPAPPRSFTLNKLDLLRPLPSTTLQQIQSSLVAIFSDHNHAPDAIVDVDRFPIASCDPRGDYNSLVLIGSSAEPLVMDRVLWKKDAFLPISRLPMSGFALHACTCRAEMKTIEGITIDLEIVDPARLKGVVKNTTGKMLENGVVHMGIPVKRSIAVSPAVYAFDLPAKFAPNATFAFDVKEAAMATATSAARGSILQRNRGDWQTVGQLKGVCLTQLGDTPYIMMPYTMARARNQQHPYALVLSNIQHPLSEIVQFSRSPSQKNEIRLFMQELKFDGGALDKNR